MTKVKTVFRASTRGAVALAAIALVSLAGTAFAPCLAAQTSPIEYAPLAFAGKQGEYVYYRDARGQSVAYVGLCVMGRNKLAIRLWESDTGNELIVLETFFTTGDKYVPGGLSAEGGTIDLIRGDFGVGRSATILSEILACADAWVKAKSVANGDGEFSGGPDGEFVFQSRVPVIQLRGTRPDADGKALELVKAGSLSSGADPAFYGWKGEGADPSVLPEVAAY
jgi:hypothetical protein